MSSKDRQSKIIKTSIIGIIINIFLVVVKIIIGLLVNSILIVIDAVNNLSDTMSSIITIIGSKLSLKKPDLKHPFGYGRVEYFTSLIISTMILIVGFFSLKESALKIINPAKTTYSIIIMMVLPFGVIIKFFLGKYYRKIAKDLNSNNLRVTGDEALMDSAFSLITFITAIISFIFNINIEAYLSLIISLFIIENAYQILVKSLDSILGENIDIEITNSLKQTINSYEEVLKTKNIVLHNYGPSTIMGTAYIEVTPDMKANNIYLLTKQIKENIYQKYNINLTIGIYTTK